MLAKMWQLLDPSLALVCAARAMQCVLLSLLADVSFFIVVSDDLVCYTALHCTALQFRFLTALH